MASLKSSVIIFSEPDLPVWCLHSSDLNVRGKVEVLKPMHRWHDGEKSQGTSKHPDSSRYTPSGTSCS